MSIIPLFLKAVAAGNAFHRSTICSRSLSSIIRAIVHLSALVILVREVILSLINQVATKFWIETYRKWQIMRSF